MREKYFSFNTLAVIALNSVTAFVLYKECFMKVIVCKWCRKTVSKQDNTATFCSKECVYKSITGINNKRWKGDNVGYVGLHTWVKNHKPRVELCQICNIKKSEELANISQKYKRDINDFMWLCKKCHNAQDKRGERSRLAKKKCKFCLKMFKPKRSKHLYCSNICSNTTKCTWRKLVDTDIIEIRLHKFSPEMCHSFAKKHNVSYQCIKSISDRKSWRHI